MTATEGKPVSIDLTGARWDDGREVCGLCGCWFMPGDEGTPVLTERANGTRTVVCYACALAMFAAGVTNEVHA
jgi:hypothetical protein